MVTDRGYRAPADARFPFTASRETGVVRVQRTAAISTADVRALVAFMEQENIGAYILVTDRPWNSKARAAVPPHLQIENFTEDELTPNPARVLPVRHRVVDVPWDDKLPILLQSDVQARYLGCRAGDVVEVSWSGQPVMLRRVAHS